MNLSDMQLNQTAYVTEVLAGDFGRGLTSRLQAMGFVPEKAITVIRKAALGGPIAVRVGSTTQVAIRRSEAALIQVQLAV
jgi:ferrous iron transport protein A